MVDSPQLGTILLIEDEAADVALLIRAFKKSGVVNPIRHCATAIRVWLTLKESGSSAIAKKILCQS